LQAYILVVLNPHTLKEFSSGCKQYFKKIFAARMSTPQRLEVSNPAAGLIVYAVDNKRLF
jgi:hypothetical protein